MTALFQTSHQSSAIASNAWHVAFVDTSKKTELIFFEERASAGTPSYAQDFIRQSLDINELLVPNPETTEYYEVGGKSMEGAGLFDKDIIAVDSSIQGQHGDIVLASYYNESLVKELYHFEGECKLIAHHPDYDDIIITHPEEFCIKGVVTGCVKIFHRKYKRISIAR